MTAVDVCCLSRPSVSERKQMTNSSFRSWMNKTWDVLSVNLLVILRILQSVHLDDALVQCELVILMWYLCCFLKNQNCTAPLPSVSCSSVSFVSFPAALPFLILFISAFLFSLCVFTFDSILPGVLFHSPFHSPLHLFLWEVAIYPQRPCFLFLCLLRFRLTCAGILSY